MPRVVDANGVTYALEGEDLSKALASGQVKLAEATAVETASGYRSALGPDTNAVQARLMGATGFVDPDEARGVREEAYREDLYGGQNFKAGLEGLASGLTLGASDVALDALGADTAERAAYNPNIRMAGEITGMVGAAVLSGGTSAGGAAGRLGMLLAKTPAGAVTKAATKAGASIGGVKGIAAGAALEGAAYSAGQTASQLLITDEPLSAEAFWAEVGKNAAFGAGAGAVGGAAFGGLAKGWNKIKAARAEAVAAAPIVDTASEAGRAAVKNLATALGSLDSVADDLAKVAPEPPPVAAVADEVVSPPVETPVAPDAPDILTSLRTAGDDLYAQVRAITPESTKLPGAAVESVPAVPSVAQRMDEAFGRLDTKGDNYVFIGDLRKALPDVPRDVFDAELNKLRKGKHFTVDAIGATGPQAKSNADLYGPDFAEHVLVEGDQPVGLVSRRGGPMEPGIASPGHDVGRVKLAKKHTMRLKNTRAALEKAIASGDEKAIRKATAKYQTTVEEVADEFGIDVSASLYGPTPDLDKFGQILKPAQPYTPPDGYTLPPQMTGPETQAIRWYADNNGAATKAEDVNAALRSGDDAERFFGDRMKGIDSLLAKSATTKPVTVFRGLKADPADFAPGAVVDHASYLSTTARLEQAEEFANTISRGQGSKIVMAIDVPPGTPAVHIPSVIEDLAERGFDEAEVLLGRGTKLRIVSREVDPAGVVRVRATIGSEAAPAVPAPEAASGLTAARRAAHDALGITDGRITEQHIARLLNGPAGEVGPKLQAVSDYIKAAREVADASGNATALGQLDDAAKAMTEAAREATAGVNLDDQTKAVLAAVFGAGEVADMAGFENPVGDLAGVALAAKYVKGKLPGAGRAAGRSWVSKATRRVAGIAGGRMVNGLGGTSGAGSLAAYNLGRSGFQHLYDAVVGQRAIASVTNNAVGRVGTAMSKLGRAGRATKPHITGPALLRAASFHYGDEPPPKPATTLQGAYEQRSAELAAFAANPLAAQARIHEQLAEVRAVAPYVADELEMLAMSVNQYLYDQMPKDPGTMTRLGESTWRPTDYELRQWAECCKGALAPLETFEDGLAGRITPKAAHAVRSLFPRLFGQMQQELAARAPELRKSLTLQDRTRLSILFDTPLDSTMRPDFRGFIAEQHAIRATEAAAAQQTARPMAGAVPNPAPLTGAQMLIV